MKQIVIDGPKALSLLEEVVAERGTEYQYKPTNTPGRCVYAYGGQPSCGVGVALFKAGVRIETLVALDELDDPVIYNVEARETLYENGVLLEGRAVNVFEAFQTRQDDTRPYGEALATAAAAL